MQMNSNFNEFEIFLWKKDASDCAGILIPYYNKYNTSVYYL